MLKEFVGGDTERTLVPGRLADVETGASWSFAGELVLMLTGTTRIPASVGTVVATIVAIKSGSSVTSQYQQCSYVTVRPVP